MEFSPESWSEVFALGTPLLELVARGTVLYFFLLVLLRLMPRRTGSELATMDLIFLLLIAEAAAHAFGDYTSLLDGIIVILTLVSWDLFINVISYHVRFVERLVSAPPVKIVRNGELLRRNLRREFLTEEELMSYLRQQGIEDLQQVKVAYIEGEGKITAIKRDS